MTLLKCNEQTSYETTIKNNKFAILIRPILEENLYLWINLLKDKEKTKLYTIIIIAMLVNI